MQQDAKTLAKTIKQILMPAQIGNSGSENYSLTPYSSIFFHSSSSPTTFAASSATSDGKSTRSAASVVAAADKLSRLMSDHKELLNRHTLCLTQLRKLFKEAETLRQENTNLRIANVELSNQVGLLIQAALQNQYQMPPFSAFGEVYGSSSFNSVFDKFGGGFPKERENGGSKEELAAKCPSSTFMAIEKDQEESEKVEEARVTLPKSISVRSDGFLKINQTPADFSGNNYYPPPATQIRPLSSVSGPQKVYVRKKDGPIELEVYNQGMLKTELCNKWQETGSCPYGNHCQFAHGIDELRPVIRHPRYKTEVCRMVFSGDPCPYGHRCHFRHALTDEEKLLLPLRLD